MGCRILPKGTNGGKQNHTVESFIDPELETSDALDLGSVLIRLYELP